MDKQTKRIEIIYKKPSELNTETFGNPRKITKVEREKLKQSIQNLGDFGIIVIDELNQVLSGNQRIQAMRELNINVPVACKQLIGYSDTEKKIINIRANKSSGEFDEDMLNDWLKEIKIEIEDISLTGFDESYLINNNILNDEDIIENENVKIFNDELLKEEIKKEITNFNDLEKYTNFVYNKYLAMNDFNLLCQGKNKANYISLLFNPHRLKVNIKGKNQFDALSDEKFKNVFSKYLITNNLCHKHPSSFLKMFSLGYANYSVATDFPSYIARNIYKYYCQKNMKIFDPCAGWGGRLIGCCSTLLDLEYNGNDVSEKTIKGLNKIKNFLNSSGKTFNANINLISIEEYKIKENYFDFAFTSSPYFDTEIYEEDNLKQSCNLYKNYEDWENGFLRILITKTMKSLKQKSKFILNVGNRKYNIQNSVLKICKDNSYKAKNIDSFINNRECIDKEEEFKSEIFLEISK